MILLFLRILDTFSFPPPRLYQPTNPSQTNLRLSACCAMYTHKGALTLHYHHGQQRPTASNVALTHPQRSPAFPFLPCSHLVSHNPTNPASPTSDWTNHPPIPLIFPLPSPLTSSTRRGPIPLYRVMHAAASAWGPEEEELFCIFFIVQYPPAYFQLLTRTSHILA